MSEFCELLTSLKSLWGVFSVIDNEDYKNGIVLFHSHAFESVVLSTPMRMQVRVLRIVSINEIAEARWPS